MLLCGAWLILREGVPTGVAPLSFAAVLLIRKPIRQWHQYNVSGVRHFFHSVLCCGSVCPLPIWIDRE
jgi:hypothetical protein